MGRLGPAHLWQNKFVLAFRCDFYERKRNAASTGLRKEVVTEEGFAMMKEVRGAPGN
jgi:hypothetical protein